MERRSRVMAVFISSIMSIVSGVQTNAQDVDTIITVSPLVGKVIDRQERNRYGLFQGFSDFQSAVFCALSDGNYQLQITYVDGGVERTQQWRISHRELLLNYRRPIESYESEPPPIRPSKGSPILRIETREGRTLRGSLTNVSGDLLTLNRSAEQSLPFWDNRSHMAKVRLDSITSLTVIRESSFFKGVVWGLFPGAIGALIGLADGDDPPGLVSFSAGTKAALAFLFFGGIGVSIGGTAGALKGVDVGIPWQDASMEERKQICSQLRLRRYRSERMMRVSPWIGRMSFSGGSAAMVKGGRFHLHFTPQSALELTYGKVGWFRSDFTSYSYSSYDERSKLEMVSGGFRIAAARDRSIIPFVSWGWGGVRTETKEVHRYTSDWDSSEYEEWSNTSRDVYVSIYFKGGVEIPVKGWMSLEGSIGDVLVLGRGNYIDCQLGLTVGSAF